MESAKLKIAGIVESLIAARVAGDRSSVVRHFLELAMTPNVQDTITHDTLVAFARLAESIARSPDATPELKQDFISAAQLLAVGATGYWSGQAFLFGAGDAASHPLESSPEVVEALCIKLIRRGNIKAAKALLSRLDTRSLTLSSSLWALSLQTERLCGRGHDVVQVLNKQKTLPLACQWEHLLAGVQSGSTGVIEMIRSQAAGNDLRQSSRMAFVSLWAWAAGDRFVTNCPSERAIRDQARREAGESSHLSLILAMINEIVAMAGAQDHAGREAAARMAMLLDRSSELPTVEHEALALAATARVATKAGAPLLAELAALSYRTLSKQLSDNSEDLWLLGNGAATMAPVMEARDFRWWAQTSHTAATLGAFAKSAVTSRIRRVVSPKSKVAGLQEREVIEMAAQLREAVKTSKGALLKVAQVLSFLDQVLPPLVAKELRAMEPEVIPLAGPLAAQIVETRIGRPLAEAFSEWSTYPIAAASIGQVHRARLKTGELVAVKVQYPHLDRYLAKQVRAIRYMIPAARTFFPGVDAERINEEICSGLVSEIDYVREAENTRLFRQALTGIEGIRVPKVYEELSGPGLLTMEYLDGVHLRDFAKTASQEDRNRAGAAIFTAVFKPRREHGLINNDPHPGNFLFSEQDIGYIDFGAATVDPELVAQYDIAYALVRDRRRQDLIEFLANTGFVLSKNPAELEMVAKCFEFSMSNWVKDEPARCDAEFLRQDFANYQTVVRFINLPPRWFGMLRGLLGTTWVMVGLGAEVNFHRILESLTSAPAKPATDRLAG